MSFKARKVAIIGTGSVGASCAFALVNQCVCEEILLVDLKRDKAEGEALDLNHGIEYMSSTTKIRVGTYEDCKDVDVIVMTASEPPRPNETRLDILEDSKGICKMIVDSVMKAEFNGFFVLVTNPVDVIAYYTWKLSGLPKNRVIGTGTALDTARLKTLISAELDEVDTKSIQAFAMGEHGDSQMVPWSKVSIAGEPLLDLMKKNDKLAKLHLDKMELKTAKLGWDIYVTKGTTYYGIASTVVGIIKSIFHDDKKVIPVSTLLEGEYGQNDVYMGVPTVIGKNGVEKIIELELTDTEKEKFNNSANVIKKYIKKLG
ncbi:L-lactate dehydrogenase [Clostridium botulinum]|uniref:L-lactate dehydrogenase n=1 Tax=Clostridium botulinum TaxID=1491 RepID=UPI0004D99D53|nr:L-lactate dehydrogenase [Clostridium botulinum]KEI07178.1 lactate dehydrogenase [Clostridium botulinum C/D str. BKT75002]KEI08736.1 lactate dehydrogenase [Clostridium botulinum C/D str. BKT2873]QPW60106.1 L-lactate dehydrogenase [Clostridium botulinum]